MHNELNFPYKHFQFRSYIESIWGIIFDELEIPFEYEKSTYIVEPGIRYIPDFWLPKQNIWIEIEGADLREIEKSKAQSRAIELHELTKIPVYIFRGIPKIDRFQGPFDGTYIDEVSRFTVFGTINPPCDPIKKKSVTQVLMEVLDLSRSGLSEIEEFNEIRIQLNDAFRRSERIMAPYQKSLR